MYEDSVVKVSLNQIASLRERKVPSANRIKLNPKSVIRGEGYTWMRRKRETRLSYEDSIP